jgi:flagellar biogenesis protein FliO
MHLVAGTKTKFESEPDVHERMRAGWLQRVIEVIASAAGAGSRRTAKRQMEIIETLAVGSKKQLVLVQCGGERFLVGTGVESVQTIVRVLPQDSERPGQTLTREWH